LKLLRRDLKEVPTPLLNPSTGSGQAGEEKIYFLQRRCLLNFLDYWTLGHKFSPLIFYSILIVTLLFGLNPKGFYFKNNVRWSTDSTGIEFGRFGIAYTDPFIEGIEGDPSLSIEIVIRPDAGDEKSFTHILTLHNGDDDSQLMLGQWLSYIVFMKGNDYENKKPGKRIWANTAKVGSDEIFVTLTSGIDGTSVYLNGQLVNTQKDLILEVPQGDSKSRLIIGNSIYGKHSWEGSIRGLALYRSVLSDHQAALHYSEWLKDGNFRFAEKEKPWVLYTFDEKTGIKAIDHGTGKNNLTIPKRMTVFKMTFLESSIEKLRIANGVIADLIINFLEFIPFGFIFSALLFRLRGKFPIYFILIAGGAGFLLSLFIEVAQAWLPSRNSDAFDLILNTTGALFGSILFGCMVIRKVSREICQKINP
jgi:hypothetical protein